MVKSDELRGLEVWEGVGKGCGCGRGLLWQTGWDCGIGLGLCVGCQ